MGVCISSVVYFNRRHSWNRSRTFRSMCCFGHCWCPRFVTSGSIRLGKAVGTPRTCCCCLPRVFWIWSFLFWASRTLDVRQLLSRQDSLKRYLTYVISRRLSTWFAQSYLVSLCLPHADYNSDVASSRWTLQCTRSNVSALLLDAGSTGKQYPHGRAVIHREHGFWRDHADTSPPHSLLKCDFKLP